MPVNAILLRFHYKEKRNRKCYVFVKFMLKFILYLWDNWFFLLVCLLAYMVLLNYYKYYIHYVC